MITRDGIRAAGLLLLDVLKEERIVPYSRFYNSTPGSDQQLAIRALVFSTELNMEYCKWQDLLEECHVMLEFAADQLEDLGIVRIRLLKQALIDGYPDFAIKLTRKGQRVLPDALGIRFHHPDYQITATPASEWLLDLLRASDRDSLTLADAMETGDSLKEVVILDDDDNAYALGTGSYAWAFEVSLWHHARAGHIVPACRSAAMQEIWSDFVAQPDRPSRPSVFEPRPLWEIPFRASDEFLRGTSQIRHVGTVS